MVMTIHHDQRLYIDPGRAHVIENQIADALVLGRVGIGPREQEHTVGELGA
jgi:hypothetical protein